MKVRPFIIIICLKAILLTSPLQAKDSIYTKIGNFLSNAITNSLNKFEYLNLETSDLGFDNGVIANVIIGYGRSVERNLKSTNENDKFLVKDTVKLGFQLGAGIVISGSAKYVQEWTIVYPVATHLKGLFHNKFILDIFLPYKVWRDKLPENYVLVTDSYIEGQARLRIGGTTALPIGTSLTASRIKLTRNFISKKSSEKINVFKDTSFYNQLTHELYVYLGLFDLPVFEGIVKKGRTTRVMKDLKWTSLDTNIQEKIMEELLFKNEDSTVDKFANQRIIENKFTYSEDYLNLLWIYINENKEFEDIITDKIYKDGELLMLNRQYQFRTQNKKEMISFTDSEKFRTIIKLSAIPTSKIKENDLLLIKPQITIDLEVWDNATKDKEIDNYYLPLIQKLTYDHEGLFSKDDFSLQSKKLSAKSLTKITLEYSEEAISHILSIKENELFEKLEKRTGKNKGFWKDIRYLNIHSKQIRRLRNSRLTLPEISLGKQLGILARHLNNSQEASKSQTKIKNFVRAMKEAVTVGQGAFNTTLLEVINSFIPPKLIRTSASFTRWPEDKDTKTPLFRIERQTGPSKLEKRNEYRFYFEDAMDYYFLI